MTTATQIANLALAHCGLSKPIQDLNTDHSVEAQMCLTWYDTARRSVLRKIPWSFATKQVVPALVASQPTPEWLYAYQYPNDCVSLNRFMSWRLNNDTRNSRVPYRIMQPVPIGLSTISPQPTTPYAQTTGLWIFTNWPGTNVNLPTILEYIFDNTNVAQWPDNFCVAMSLYLADLIVTTLTTGNPQQQQQIIQAQYKSAMLDAANDDVNDEQRPPEPESEFIRGRIGDEAYGNTAASWVAQPAGFVVQ